MDTTNSSRNDTIDALDDYASRVAGMHDKTMRVANSQLAVCDTLRRTAEALRRLAMASRRQR